MLSFNKLQSLAFTFLNALVPLSGQALVTGRQTDRRIFRQTEMFLVFKHSVVKLILTWQLGIYCV